jgi:sugar lactone lactonase YvrE
VVLVDAMQQATSLANVNGTVYGLRYRPDGFLVIARPNQGVVAQISPAGMVSQVVAGLATPNGLYPDFDGNVWVTEFGGDTVSRINPDMSVDTIASGAPEVDNPNGIVYDATRTMLFYTNYGAGQIMSVNLTPGGNPTPTLVTTIQGALDGLVLDACGNLYAVDNADNELYRVRLDAAGVAQGAAELLSSFPTSVANAQFGSGQGFDPMTLYVTGNPGNIYAVAAGVAGAPVPTPP